MVSHFVSEKELAETYDSETGWQTVQQYRKATRLREQNPKMARAAIARQVGRAPSAVRGWLHEGKTPQVVQGIMTAQEKGWIDIESTSEQWRALNQLVAWIFAGGGISQKTFSPHFSVDDQLALATLHQLLRWANISYRVRRREQAYHSLEISLREGGTVLGRVLRILGAPQGVKAQQDELTLPPYLERVKKEHQREFAQIYILNRCRDLSSSETAGAYVYGISSETFAHELQHLFESITTGEATVSSHDQVWLSSESVRDLAEEEPFRPALATRTAFGSLTPPTARALASTYRQSQRPGGYRSIQLYNCVQESDNPRSELTSRYPDLSQTTIQSWRRGHKPYPKNGVLTAREHGWLTPSTTSEIALGLTTLLTWTFARESLAFETYYPSFPIATTEERRQLEAVAADLSISFTVLREASAKRSTEMRPSEHGAALGRILFTLGAPRGHKKENCCLPPTYLYQRLDHAKRFITTLKRLQTTNDNSQSLLTVPARLGTQFVNAVELLLTDYLDWSIDRESEYQLRVRSNGTHQSGE